MSLPNQILKPSHFGGRTQSKAKDISKIVGMPVETDVRHSAGLIPRRTGENPGDRIGVSNYTTPFLLKIVQRTSSFTSIYLETRSTKQSFLS
eukprot:scaffold1112_cov92-Amphora_coffeaeformis.AAC.15